VATFRYTEPMSWWMTIPAGVQRDYGVAMDYLKRYATGAIGDAGTKNLALATESSADYTDDGKLAVSIVDAPWAHGALFTDNCNPRVPYPPGGTNRAHVSWNPTLASELYDHPEKGVQDGEYLDSLEGWSDVKNFRREHFAAATEPLTFDTMTRRPCILQALSTYEFTQWLSNDVHRRNKLMFANSTPARFFWYAGLLDVMGTETNWLRDGAYQPDDDEMMLYRRLLSGHKPYLLLMNTDFDKFDHAMVEKYMKRSLLYGIFPSMFSHNAADKPYWENPAWYNRDRDLFVKYIPIIRSFAMRGWEPVTGARTDDASVWVERFGGQDGGSPSFTVFNSGTAARDVALRLDPKTLSGPIPPAFVDRVTGKRIEVKNEAGRPTLRLTIGAEETAALEAGI
jgi:hypothetical protein